MRECSAWDFAPQSEHAETPATVPCHEPATHSAYGPLGHLRFYCARHFDQMVATIRNFESEGRFLSGTSKVRKLNPGLL